MSNRSRRRRWSRFFGRFTVGILLAFIAVVAPCPAWSPDIFTWWQVPIVVLALILYMGVLLFDTLFFDRYT